MEGDITQGSIGSVGKYDLSFKDGQLIAEVDASAGAGSASLAIKLGAGAVLDALAAAIPGKIDDAVIGLIKAALLGK